MTGLNLRERRYGMKHRHGRDLEKTYSDAEFVRKLRRLADSIESGTPFRIQIAGERITVPPEAVANIEHERGRHEEEIEFQLKWRLD